MRPTHVPPLGGSLQLPAPLMSGAAPERGVEELAEHDNVEDGQRRQPPPVRVAGGAAVMAPEDDGWAASGPVRGAPML